jgi:hypothetical protein
MEQRKNKTVVGLRESVIYLEKWLDQAEALARDIRRRAQQENIQSFFTIASTVKVREDSSPFLTPIRRLSHGFIGGVVVFSQTQAILLSKRIDGLVDQILVDAEKKIGVSLGIDEYVLEHFGLEYPNYKDNARVHVELGNLTAACSAHIKKSLYGEYKPNDMTVEAVWHFLAQRFGELGGRKVAIIGSGNIGFKLALKLVESGTNVELVRRDLGRGMLMADAINITKPQSTMASAKYNSSPLHAALFCDALIGCTNGKAAITKEMIQAIKPNGIVIDVGKGSIHADAVLYAVENEVPIIRCDISSAMDGLISTLRRNKMIMSRELGRQKFETDIFLVSGGYLGLAGDIVVDNYQEPRQIIGVCDGMGDLKGTPSAEDLDRLEILKKRMSHGKD